MKTLRDILPRASRSVRDLNPQLISKNDSSAILSAAKGKRRGSMNATEQEFWMILQEQKKRGEILRAEYEGISLKWGIDPDTGKGMWYRPDFLVFVKRVEFHDPDTNEDMFYYRQKLVEVKGAHIWDRDIVRFKGARAYWPEFAFECWQKTKNGWKRRY